MSATSGTFDVEGYIFPAFTRKQARAFNFFNQMCAAAFREVKCGPTIMMLVNAEPSEMQALCSLICEEEKPLVTVQATESKYVEF